MKKVCLAKSNPYLKSSQKRRKLLAKSVNTSSAIEGIRYKTSARKKKVKK